MDTKHTPGPWSISIDSDLWPLIMAGGESGKIIANVNPESFSAGIADFAEMPAEHNARLIAAAPELLEVAQSILAEDMLQYLPAEYVSKVRAVIEKATGSQA